MKDRISTEKNQTFIRLIAKIMRKNIQGKQKES